MIHHDLLDELHEDFVLDDVVVPTVICHDRWLAFKHSADVALLAVVGLTNGFDNHVEQI